MEESLDSLNACQSALDTHHVTGELLEAGQMLILHIAGPRTPDGSQTSSMCHAKETAQFVLQLMTGEVFLCAALRQVVMRQ